MCWSVLCRVHLSTLSLILYSSLVNSSCLTLPRFSALSPQLREFSGLFPDSSSLSHGLETSALKAGALIAFNSFISHSSGITVLCCQMPSVLNTVVLFTLSGVCLLVCCHFWPENKSCPYYSVLGRNRNLLVFVFFFFFWPVFCKQVRVFLNAWQD